MRRGYFLRGHVSSCSFLSFTHIIDPHMKVHGSSLKRQTRACWFCRLRKISWIIVILSPVAIICIVLSLTAIVIKTRSSVTRGNVIVKMNLTLVRIIIDITTGKLEISLLHPLGCLATKLLPGTKTTKLILGQGNMVKISTVLLVIWSIPAKLLGCALLPWCVLLPCAWESISPWLRLESCLLVPLLGGGRNKIRVCWSTNLHVRSYCLPHSHNLVRQISEVIIIGISCGHLRFFG